MTTAITAGVHLRSDTPVVHRVFTTGPRFVTVQVGQDLSGMTVFAESAADLDRLAATVAAARADLMAARAGSFAQPL